MTQLKINIFMFIIVTTFVSYNNCSEDLSRTPLMQAVLSNSPSKVKLLISQAKAKKLLGGNTSDLRINAQDKTGQTALMWALANKLPDIAKLLLSIGDIDVTIKDKDGLTALDLAVEDGNKEIVQAILDLCPKKNGRCPLIDQQDKKVKWTQLARAARSGNKDIIDVLLKAGANPTVMVSQAGNSIPVFKLYKGDDKELNDLFNEYTNRGLALIEAIQDHKPNKAKELLAVDYIDVNAKDKHGQTALHLAVDKNYNEVVKLLIDKGADVNAKTSWGATPLHLVANRIDKDIVQLLKALLILNMLQAKK